MQSAMPMITDRQVIESDGMNNNTPGVAQAANGDWVLTYRKNALDGSTSLVILRRSSDNGQTWGAEQVYFSSPDPGVVETPKGALLLSLVTQDSNGSTGAAVTRSLDYGLTWSPFTFLSAPASLIYAFSPSLVNAGASMLGTSYSVLSGGANQASFWTSADDGVTWTETSSISQPGDASINETTIARVGAAQFIAMSRDNANTSTWVHFSNDSGMTWGSQLDYTPQVGILQDPQLLQVHNMVLVFAREFIANGPPPHSFVMYASFDNGQTFTNRTVLDTYGGTSVAGGYCWPLVESNGSVFLVYYADSHTEAEIPYTASPDIKSLVLQWN